MKVHCFGAVILHADRKHRFDTFEGFKVIARMKAIYPDVKTLKGLNAEKSDIKYQSEDE